MPESLPVLPLAQFPASAMVFAACCSMAAISRAFSARSWVDGLFGGLVLIDATALKVSLPVDGNGVF
jgi:hypothetical protein